jgi:histidine triad (HIT) family protein
MSSRGPAIDLPASDDCAFCDYLSGQRPYTVLWREDRVAVLVTREQRGIGHLLVLPTRHVPSLLHLLDDEAETMMIAVRDAGTLPGGGTDFGVGPELSVAATDAIGRRLASFVPDRPLSHRRVDPGLTRYSGH